ncbi:MAG: heteromeric transposase endonuclease subunit TnsA [Firmicutes bacterium HGW-Firmicutes-15]|nr:MAG: heteromeric transposase endonuclease subunit TnsA [Firmicutes bacterium HGW-Firmicutes-15]
MSKYRLNWDEERVQKYIKKGRGQGEGRKYKPWLTVRDVPSRGRSTRAFGWKTRRVHHMLSDHETRYFYLSEWSNNVIDIREQYPILDRDETMKIAKDLKFRYPHYIGSKTPLVLTTDFVLTLIEDGHKKIIARTIKPIKELKKQRVRELFKIEEKYWAEQGIDWGIVTDLDIPKVLARNIEELHSAAKLENIEGCSIDELMFMREPLLDRLLSFPNMQIRKILNKTDLETNKLPGTALYLFWHLLATKRMTMELNKPFDIRKPASILDKGVNFEGRGLYNYELLG